MKQPGNIAFPVARLLSSFIHLALFLLLLFLLAGDWRWLEGWIFSAIFAGGSFGTILYLYFTDPALLNERYRSPVQKEQKGWDKILLVPFFLEFLGWFVIMPLDARRFKWTQTYPFELQVTGGLLLLASFYILFMALRENTFAAPVVKMQRKRGHHVIATGPYAVVRHPMYAGALLLFVGGPLLLSSNAGLVFAGALIATLVVRTIGEERMLKEELPGYRNYTRKVKSRLIPFVF